MGNNYENSMIIDCFAGGGGASVGIEMALGRRIDIAINHDPDAIIMHKVNHPDTLHLTEDIFSVDLQKYVGDKHVALLWASPDCFPAGNLVWTSKGYVSIEDVRPFDYVTTHKGNLKMVTNFIKKNDRKFVNVKISGCEEFQATLNHPFYVRKKYAKTIHKPSRTVKTIMREAEWVKAEDLTTDYRVAIPINRESIIPKWNGIMKTTANTYGITTAWIENNLSKYMGNADFWWIVGRYMGDGSIAKDIVDICCSFKEINEIKPHLDRLSLPYTERDKKTTHSFLFSNKELCEFLRQFGVGSSNKTITPEILNLPCNLLKCFLEGYISADGCYEDIKTNSIIKVSTISRTLAYGLQQCFLKAYGVYGSLVKSKTNSSIILGRRVKCHGIYRLSFYMNKNKRTQCVIEDNIAWVNIRSVNVANDVQKSVYCLSVQDDESFTVNNIAVHNCRSFSKAKGGAPKSKSVRMLPWAVHKHAKAILPDVIVMENVEEIQQWGPLDDEGRPIKEREGEEYQKFVKAMCELGYEFDSKELVAADYGAPTTRKRWYAIFRRDGRPIVWPEPTHAKNPVEVPDRLKPWKSCGDYIDWSDLGKSIFGREKPLADSTRNRIVAGIDKFIVNCDRPYIVKDKAALDYIKKYHNINIDGAIAASFITKYYKTGIGQTCFEPCHTITTSAGHFGLVTAFLIKYYGTGGGQTMAEPLATITTKDRFGLVNVLVEYNGEKYIIADVFLRMLKPEELKLMQGFPTNYIIDHNIDNKKISKADRVKRIGNSVVPMMAKAIIAVNCGYLKVKESDYNLHIA